MTEGPLFFEPIADCRRLDGLVIGDSSPTAPVVVYDADSRPFWGVTAIDRPIQPPGPLKKIEDLRADFWPGAEDVDEFLNEVRRWRDEDDRALSDSEDRLS